MMNNRWWDMGVLGTQAGVKTLRPSQQSESEPYIADSIAVT